MKNKEKEKQPESVEKFNWDKYYGEERNDPEMGPHIKRAEKVIELELLHHKGGFEAILDWHEREVERMVLDIKNGST